MKLTKGVVSVFLSYMLMFGGETVFAEDYTDSAPQSEQEIVTYSEDGYEVSSGEEFHQAVEAIKEIPGSEANIILKNNCSIDSFAGIAGKHITLKSTDENCFRITGLGTSLEGDVTLDNVLFKGDSTTIYANGHTFETTDRFGGTSGSSINTIYGGGSGGNDVAGDTNIVLRGNVSVSNVYGGGQDSNVAGNTRILTEGANTKTSNIWGGGHAKNTLNGKVGGDTNVVLRQGTNGFLVGGGHNGYATDNSEGAREPASVTGTANVTVGYKGAPAQSMEFGTAMYAYGGSWHSTVGNVNFQMLDGAWSPIENTGRSYYGCGYRDTVRGTVTVVVDGADLADDRVYGGGNQESGMEAYGNVEILNENNEPHALHIIYKPGGISEGVNAGSNDTIPTVIKGDVLLEVQNGDMLYAILDNEGSGSCTIDGTATIKISGNSTHIAQVQGNKKHVDDSMPEKSQVVYENCGTAEFPQKTGYLHWFGQVLLQENANVSVDSNAFSVFNGVQNPFYTVENLKINPGCVLTTRNSNTLVKNSVEIDGGTWRAKGNVYVYETMKSRNGHIFFDNYFAIGYDHRTDDNPVEHLSFQSENDEFVALKSGYTGKFYGNVELDKSDMAFMCPVNVRGNWNGGDSLLRVPAVPANENYDGTSRGGTIALNIDGIATGKMTVKTVAAEDWKTFKKPTLGDNYVTGYTGDHKNPTQETFVLGNEDALADGYYLKRLADPGAPEDYFMWQVAQKESYPVVYEFISGTEGKKLPNEVTALLPVDTGRYFDGTKVTAISPANTTVTTADGIWTFTGYEPEEQEAVKESLNADGHLVFKGIWEFGIKAGVINAVPAITAEDKTLTVGDVFDPMESVTASDKEDGDITDEIKVISNNVDNSKAGTYEVTYEVTDSVGASVTKTIKVIVKERGNEIIPGENETNPGENETNPGENETNPGENETNPGENETNPGGNETNPGENATNPGGNESNPGENETNPGGNEENLDKGEMPDGNQTPNNEKNTGGNNGQADKIKPDGAPSTGDSTDLGLWLSLLAASGGFVTILARKRGL